MFTTGRDGHWRIRHDKVDKTGRVTLRHASRLHHIGLGYEHNGTTVRILIHDLHITVINADTGELIRDLTLDPTRDSNPWADHPAHPKAAHNAAAENPPHIRSPGRPVNDVPGLHSDAPELSRTRNLASAPPVDRFDQDPTPTASGRSPTSGGFEHGNGDTG